ncbi:jumonji protein [Artomyces pyxidatus]|uniref:Jumonji protein n=1 Tax=Artomyces pyxidatus TaxID=48021 RepID=A0ACB8TBS0_9AGAM|nr:jumonji protein [Artomyces pyxidatus]
MTKPTRRSLRSTAPHSSGSDPASLDAPAEPRTNGRPEDSCPACTETTLKKAVDADKENWIRCDACRLWYHWRCVGGDGELEAIDKWFCDSCREQAPTRVITFKPPARKSTRNKAVRDYAHMHTGVASDSSKWAQMLEHKSFGKDNFRRMEGSQLSQEWLDNDPTAMTEPVLVEEPQGLGMKMPDRNLSVDDIAEIMGRDTTVEVIDVPSQSNLPGWTLGKWSQYYSLQPSDRDKIRNVISLEISGSKLSDQILPPRLVRELDWVEKFWPNTKKGKGHAYPKVQLYCLMGVQGAWTDWHIDFAGSSVYYHILRGAKTFLFIRPTPANLTAYERWSGTEIQSNTWLGDMVDEVIRVDLTEGNTMIIPTGWIHAVYTPMDALVFGGNFLHSYNVAVQLKVRNIEIATQVPKKFRYPYFSRLSWYVGEKYLRDLRAKEEFSPRVLESIDALAEFLVSEARTLERGSEAAKREAKEQVPSEKVKDASAVARELRWRARLASGYGSDGEDVDRPKTKGGEHAGKENGLKRKRVEEHTGPWAEGEPKFRNFQPKLWDAFSENDQHETRRSLMPPPDKSEHWKETWMDWTDESTPAADGEDVEVGRKRQVIVRVRRTPKGLERQRVERVVEEWGWRPKDSGLDVVTVKGS